MNYVVDPEVRGTVIINTLGELRREDLFPLLQMILRINGATAVQSGSFYRIVPLAEVQRIPVESMMNATAAQMDPDDRVVMNIIPLKYVSAVDMTKILTPFLSEGGHLVSHEGGNILIVTDTSRSMRRVLELVAQFDTEVFSNQRARLYPIQSSRAERIAAELQQVFSAYGLSAGTSAIRFVPIERVNSVLVVTANASVYPEVEQWLQRLDQPMADSGVRTFIYKVENGDAQELANVLSRLLSGGALLPQTVSPPQVPGGMAPGAPQPTAPAVPQTAAPAAAPAPLQMQAPPPPSGEAGFSHIRIVADRINNQIVIQSTAQEYEELRRTLQELDIVPRQVMIEAKVYEVDLTGALSAGVSAFLRNRTAAERKPLGSFATAEGSTTASLNVSVGTLVGMTRELMIFLNAAENRSEARVISAPSILASDNVRANINVGTEVPILTSQALVRGTQVEGENLFTNTIQNRDTGVLLSITPRINSSGLVNMQIQQEVSAPLPPSATGIQSPSIQKRSISTQVVVRDGETIALGGIIQENRTTSKNRVPLLGDIPYVGALFGNTSRSSQRTELIILLTPTVIRDTNEAQQATAEFRQKLEKLQEVLREEEEKQRKRQEEAQKNPAPES
jgi:general secretion pathway protein D